MKIVKNINGVEIELTAEEIAQKEAEEKEWADGANDRMAATHRDTRNALLAASDWTQANDSPLAAEKKVEWASYRTALRNLPSSSDWPDVTFPTEPS
jgi:hypothetical protein